MPGSGPRGRSEFRAYVEVTGAQASADAIRYMGARAAATLPLMERISDVLFESQKARVSEAPWAPLTEGTVARKAQQGEDTDILRDEWRPIRGTPTRKGDALYSALTIDGADGQIKRFTRTWAIFGVNSSGQNELFYARFVQNVGGKKRRLLAINETTAVTVIEMVGHWIRPPGLDGR